MALAAFSADHGIRQALGETFCSAYEGLLQAQLPRDEFV
jgi:hypothetical protein